MPEVQWLRRAGSRQDNVIAPPEPPKAKTLGKMNQAELEAEAEKLMLDISSCETNKDRREAIEAELKAKADAQAEYDALVKAGQEADPDLTAKLEAMDAEQLDTFGKNAIGVDMDELETLEDKLVEVLASIGRLNPSADELATLNERADEAVA